MFLWPLARKLHRIQLKIVYIYTRSASLFVEGENCFMRLQVFRFVMVLCCAALLPLSVARAGPPIECDVTIEINALRGQGPTVNVPGTRNITAKARIQKGTGPADQTLDDTSLIIEAFDGATLIDTQISPDLLTLIIGKGGQGDKLTMTVNQCVSGSIDFFATFTGTSSSNGTICSETSRVLRKECKF